MGCGAPTQASAGPRRAPGLSRPHSAACRGARLDGHLSPSMRTGRTPRRARGPGATARGLCGPVGWGCNAPRPSGPTTATDNVIMGERTRDGERHGMVMRQHTRDTHTRTHTKSPANGATYNERSHTRARTHTRYGDIRRTPAGEWAHSSWVRGTRGGAVARACVCVRAHTRTPWGQCHPERRRSRAAEGLIPLGVSRFAKRGDRAARGC